MSVENEPGTWGAGVAALIGLWWGVKKLLRRDKEDASASDVVLKLNEATKAVIENLEKRLKDLTQEVVSLKEEIRKLILQNTDCERQNLLLKNEVDTLNRKVDGMRK